MAIGANSYSSVAEVTAFTRHLLDGAAGFDTATRPTLVEVEKFIDRASGALNVALVGAGLNIPISQATAKLACDDWVTARAVEYVELTQRGTGYSDAEGSRVGGFRNLQKAADQFAAQNALAFKRLGVTAGYSVSDGLQFTGQDVDRADPSDTSLEQPMFTRHLFDEPTQSGFTREEDQE